MKVEVSKINEIIKFIANNYKPSKIFLFGSYCNGNVNDDSDIDLLIIKDTNEKINKRGIVINKLLKNYKLDFDIIVYTPTEFEQMRNSINTLAFFVNKTGKLIYEA